jgi:hypothetical protein
MFHVFREKKWNALERCKPFHLSLFEVFLRLKRAHAAQAKRAVHPCFADR